MEDSGIGIFRERTPARAMTFLHAANCLAVVFVPPWMIYQYKLKEYCESSGALVRAGFWCGPP